MRVIHVIIHFKGLLQVKFVSELKQKLFINTSLQIILLDLGKNVS